MGLIGASLAAAVTEAFPDAEVVGVDVDARARALAAERGWTARALAPDDPALADFVRERCDLVVIATPVACVDDYFRALADWGFDGVVTDTISTKAHVLEAAADLLPEPRNYVPGHPMTGSEVNGVDGARTDLFKGTNWILCPDADTVPEHFQRLHELITGMEARVVSLRREEHDRAVAIVSHVPHMVASSLVELASRHADDTQSLMRLAAGGFKDTTRVAAGSPKLWCGIAFDNAAALRDGLVEMQGIIGSFVDALEAGDRGAFTDLLVQAADARRALPAAWVPSTDNLLEVRVPMVNRAGVVAEVTTIASSVGCNIQSIEIDHVSEGNAVLSLILTDEGDVGQLSLQLIKAGFSVSFSPILVKEYAHVD
nr:prephenate dehydrogenase/arogenate dehydrogenase family protein [Adlercreutzia sp. JBNU-10]